MALKRSAGPVGFELRTFGCAICDYLEEIVVAVDLSHIRNVSLHPVRHGSRHPIVENDVAIYAGATLLGRIGIGRRSTIGIGVTTDVPPNSIVTPASARSEVGLP
jgi:acetyltransferase-like isoleucine patch superfamily enzyme